MFSLPCLHPLISVVNKSTEHFCNACQLWKHTRLPFTSTISDSYFPFQLLHADVWTSPIASVFGFQLHLVILDDYSHYVWTFPLRQKSDVTLTLISFHSYVCTHFQRQIVAFQTDNGWKFDNHAHFLLNRRPCTSTGSLTRHDLLLGAPPDCTLLRVFGCACYPNLTTTTPNKFSLYTTRCIFFSYSPDHRGYRYYMILQHAECSPPVTWCLMNTLSRIVTASLLT